MTYKSHDCTSSFVRCTYKHKEADEQGVTLEEHTIQSYCNNGFNIPDKNGCYCDIDTPYYG